MRTNTETNTTYITRDEIRQMVEARMQKCGFVSVDLPRGIIRVLHFHDLEIENDWTFEETVEKLFTSFEKFMGGVSRFQMAYLLANMARDGLLPKTDFIIER